MKISLAEHIEAALIFDTKINNLITIITGPIKIITIIFS